MRAKDAQAKPATEHSLLRPTALIESAKLIE